MPFPSTSLLHPFRRLTSSTGYAWANDVPNNELNDVYTEFLPILRIHGRIISLGAWRLT